MKSSRKIYAANSTEHTPEDATDNSDSHSTSSMEPYSSSYKSIDLRKGCLSCIERIPLTCKLIMMNSISLIGTIIISAFLMWILFVNMTTDQDFWRYETLCVYAGTIV